MLPEKIQHNYENSEKEAQFLHMELTSNTVLFDIMLSWESILKHRKNSARSVDLNNSSQNTSLYVQKLNEPYSDHLQRLELQLAEWRKGKTQLLLSHK